MKRKINFNWKGINYKRLLFYFLVSSLILLQIAFSAKHIVNEKELPIFLIGLPIFFLFTLFAIFLISRPFIFSSSKPFSAVIRPALTIIILVIVVFFINLDVIFKLDVSRLNLIPISLGIVVKNLIFIFSFFLLSLGIGEKIFSLLQIGSINYGEKCLFSIALGLGFISYLLFFITSLGVAYSIIVYSLFLLLALASWKNILVFLKYLLKIQLVVKENQVSYWNIYLISFAFLIFLLTFIHASANILSGGWDTFHQYLTFPSAYADHHKLVYFPYHPHWGFPQNGEMLYLAGILLGGIEIPFMLNYFFVLLTSIVIFQIIRKFGSKNITWVMAIIVSTPIFLSFQGGYLKVDSILSFYSALFFLAVYYLFQENGRGNMWLMIAIILGLSFSTKYTAVLVAISFLVVIFILRKRLPWSWKKITLMGLTIVLLYLPWGIKNYLYYQNPFYPLVSGGTDYFETNLGVLCHRYFVENCSEDMYVMGDNMDFKFTSRWLSNLVIGIKSFAYTFPVNITNPGPWILIFSPFYIYYFRKIKDSYIRFLYLFSIIFSIGWMILLSGQMWYLVPALIGWLIILGYLFVNKISLSKYNFLKFSIIFWLFFNVFILLVFANYREKIKFVKGEYTYEQAASSIKTRYKENSRYKWLKAWQYLDRKLSDEKSSGLVYSFLDTRGYFVRDSHKNFIPDFFGYLFRCMNDHGDVYDQMKTLGVRYIIVDEDYKKYVRSCKKERVMSKFRICQTEAAFKSFIEQHGERVFKEGSVAVYELK